MGITNARSHDQEITIVTLKALLRLQLTYALLGTSYNLCSMVMMYFGAPPLSATSAVGGLLAMAVYMLFLIPGFFGHHKTYRLLMTASVLALGYGGVINHLLNINEPQLYHSTTAWAFAIGINLFGLCLNLMAALGKYDRRTQL